MLRRKAWEFDSPHPHQGSVPAPDEMAVRQQRVPGVDRGQLGIDPDVGHQPRPEPGDADQGPALGTPRRDVAPGPAETVPEHLGRRLGESVWEGEDRHDHPSVSEFNRFNGT